jgi:hypothetical protein
LTINTAASACSSPAVASAGHGQHILAAMNARRDDEAPLATLHTTQAGVAIAGLLFVGLFGRRSRRFATFSAVCVFAAIGFATWGCAGGTSSPPPPSSPTAAKGTYVVTIVGTDTASTSITASTTLTLTID